MHDHYKCLAVVLLACGATAPAMSMSKTEGPFPVSCMGKVVGELDISVRNIVITEGPPPVSRLGLSASFSPNEGSTLADAYAKCGVVGFNWLQVVKSAVHVPVDSNGKPLKTPFLDPPPGGYGDNPATPGNDSLPADQYSMYYNVGNFDPTGPYHINAHTTDNVLSLDDAPTWPTPTQSISFKTYLVGYDANFKVINNSMAGFTWTWDNRSGTTVIEWCYTGAPEPATWITMLAGFGFIGGALRRRRVAAAS